MNQGKLVFAQLMQHLPLTTFRRCVTRYQGERKVKSQIWIAVSVYVLVAIVKKRLTSPHRSMKSYRS